MLNEAKQRNDVLSQAYAALHAEYVQLRTSRRKEQQLSLDGGLPRPAYGGAAALVFDPTMGAAVAGAGGDRLDMDLLMYSSDLTPGANTFAL